MVVQEKVVDGAPYCACQTASSLPVRLEALAAMSTPKAVASSIRSATQVRLRAKRYMVSPWVESPGGRGAPVGV